MEAIQGSQDDDLSNNEITLSNLSGTDRPTDMGEGNCIMTEAEAQATGWLAGSSRSSWRREPFCTVAQKLCRQKLYSRGARSVCVCVRVRELGLIDVFSWYNPRVERVFARQFVDSFRESEMPP